MSHQTFDQSVPLAEQRLAVALAKSARNKSKNHGTGKRNAAIARAKKQAAQAKIAAAKDRHRRHKDAARAYWRGERDTHP